MRTLTGLVLGLTMAMTTAGAAEVTVPATARTLLQLTAYGDGVAFVRESRTVELPAGTSEVALEGVAPQLVPSSVVVASDDARIQSVRYDFAVLSPETLLQKFVGREVGVIRTNPKTGEETQERATVLTTNGGLILRYGDRIETGQPDRLVFDSVPEGLRLKPTLLAAVETTAAGKRQIELGYLAGGVEWSADYALTFDPVRERLAIAGRAILSNRSGIDFTNATVSLVAGEINRAGPPPAPAPMPRAAKAEAMMAAPMADAAQRETIGDAHLYTLPKPITLADDETRQIPLFATAEVPAKVVYINASNPYPAARRDGIERSHPVLQISFVNESAQAKGPGVPLPAGVARIYVADKSGAPRLIGEDRIDHTAVGERVELEPGQAFDITVARRQTGFNRLDAEQRLFEASYAIQVKNAKDRTAEVRVVETLPGDWQILAESTPHQKTSANVLAWPLSVPAGGEVELTYTVRVRL
jgi:Uncharacterized conserved protein